MRLIFTPTLCLLLCIGSGTATAAPAPSLDEAKVVYVTDELRLGLYRTEETSGRSMGTLISGARLEVLERALMSIRVRTEEGTEGWVKTAYIVTAEPARRRVAALETQLEETTVTLAGRDAALESARAELSTLNAELSEARQGIADLPSIRSENAELQAALNEGGIRVPILWLLISALIALLSGAVLGYLWLDRRVRRQFGGLRVY